ncbi:hypothetical protein DPM19_00555 [Actinomadura craniellae]|uniref:HlyC/CorC family transporter n=1 Tax=Actinomadura craniellae TaxID=2231787 RepID=A0A365HC88_9ACTN|nr:hemolysin family protein [Actinomadura craniellae]RAY16711.1 hypothetical protein DPM19_00555 [Actinomadura craniellae]
MDPLTGAVVTGALLAGNGFFVGAEFALVAAKRHRLERAAARGSRAATSAVAGIRELSLMLAGAQLGITMCTLGLGMVSEPIFAHALEGPLHAAGVPEALLHPIAFAVALTVVTYLHMVVGEMAPKSWAIAHPERSAILLALPFRGFTRLVRPLLAVLNGASNLVLRLGGVRPRDEIATRTDPQRLRFLLGESRRLGLIDRFDHALLSSAITTRQATIEPLVVPIAEVTTVPATADLDEICRAAAASGHTRLVVRGGNGSIAGALHVREALTDPFGSRAAAELARPVPQLPANTPITQAVTALRRDRAQLAAVLGLDGRPIGIVSLDDLLNRLLPAPG